MMRSLYSGISGLKNHQTRMDVIGNNIANVNTVGYKTSRVIFQDIFSQTAKSGSYDLYQRDLNNGATSPRNIGGTNPLQIGLGIKLATVDVLHTPAPIQRTDNPFDMMIEGDGYFILQDENQNYYYTRAGNFYLDDEGYLVSSHGYYVMAYTYDLDYVAAIPPEIDNEGVVTDEGSPASVAVGEDMSSNLRKIRLRVPNGDYDGVDDPTNADYIGPEFLDLIGFSVGKNGDVSVIIDNIKQTIGFLGIGMFSNPGGLEKAGDSLYRESPASGHVVETMALMDGAGRTLGGGLEMSNVDLATEFTDMIVTQRGFQANSRVITVSDTLLEELVNLKR